MHDQSATEAATSVSSSLPTLRSRWQRVCDVSWGEAIDGAAVFVDVEQRTCYVHGGRVLKQGNKVSSALFAIYFAADATPSSTAAVVFTEDDIAGVLEEVEAEASAELQHDDSASNLETMLRQLRQGVRIVEYDAPRGQLEAAPTTTISDTAGVGTDTCGGISPGPPSLAAPALYDHVLFRHGLYLVLHGGRDGYGVVHNRLLTYHLSAHTWEDLYGLLGGCVAPRLYGHAVALLDESNGTYLLLGVESDPRGVAHVVPPRKRCRAGDGRTDTTAVAPSEMARVGLSAFVLHMNAFQKGWTRLPLQNGGPAGRRYFALDTHTRGAPRGAAEVAYVIGGRMGSREYLDAWQLTLATGTWRSVCFDLHPSVDLLPVPLFTSSHASRQAEDDGGKGIDKVYSTAASIYDRGSTSYMNYSVQPYVVYVVPSCSLRRGGALPLPDTPPPVLSLLSISRTRAAAHRARRDGACHLHTFALATDGTTRARRGAGVLHCRALSTVELSGLYTTNNLCFVTLVGAQSWLCRVGRTGTVEVALLP